MSNHLKVASKEVNSDDELSCASSNECDSAPPLKVNYEIDSSSSSSLNEVSSSDLTDERKSISSIEEKSSRVESYVTDSKPVAIT